jgi:hypothetical protein
MPSESASAMPGKIVESRNTGQPNKRHWPPARKNTPGLHMRFSVIITNYNLMLRGAVVPQVSKPASGNKEHSGGLGGLRCGQKCIPATMFLRQDKLKMI